MFKNKHMIAIGPMGQNVTDSYVQIGNIFTLEAAECEECGDTACFSNNSGGQKLMPKIKPVEGKREKISKHSNYTMLRFWGASLVLGACIVISVFLIKYIKFNTK